MEIVLKDILFENANFAIAIKKIIWTEDKRIKDILTLHVNQSYLKFFNVANNDVENKLLSKKWPHVLSWIDRFGESLLKDSYLENEFFSESYNRWLKITIKLFDNEFLIVSYFDITHEKSMFEKILNDSLGFLNMYQNELFYQQITDFVREMSGADYAVLNVFEENKSDFKTVALSGVSTNIIKATEILGFNLINKTWAKDDNKLAKLKNKDIYRFESLSDLIGDVINPKIAALLSTIFRVGDVCVLRIYKDNINIGDFTLIFNQHKHLKNESFLILYARIVAIIIERNSAFNKLQESNTRFGEVALQSKELIWETNKDGFFTYINTICYELLGIMPEDIMFKTTFFDLVDPISNKRNYESLKIKFQNYESILDFELAIKTSQGVLKTFTTNAKAVFSNNGEFLGYRGAFHDITLEKKSLNELLQLSFAVEQSPASVVITDINANIIFVNNKFTQVTGYSFAEVKGKNPKILQAKQGNKKFYYDLWEKLLNGKTWSGEFANKRKNGEVFYELATISPVKNEQGEIISYIAIKEDITEKKAIQKELENNQKQLNKIYNSLPVLVFIVDENGCLQYANNQFKKKLVEADFLGKKICDIFGCNNPENEKNNCDNCSLITNIQLAFSENKTQNEIEYHFSFGNNKLHDSVYIGNTVLINFQNKKHVLVCLSDISLQNRIQKDLSRQLSLQKLVTEVTHKMVNATREDISNSVNEILESVSLFFELERSYLFLLDEQKQCFINANSWSHPDCNHPFSKNSFSNLDYFPWWKHQFKTKRRVCFSHISEVENIPDSEKQAYNDLNVHSLLCFPLINGHRIAGFLAFDTVKRIKIWTNDSISILEIITEIISKNLFKHFAEESYRLSDERFKLLIKANNDGIWDWQISSDDLFLSPRWKEIIGYEDNEIENKHKVFEELIHPDDYQYVMTHLDGYLNGTNAEYRVEFRMKHKKGHYVWIHSRGELLRDSNEKPYRIAGSHTDITPRKKQEESILKKQQLLSAIVDSTDELMRNVNYVEALQKVMKILGETTKVDRVYLFQLKNNRYEKIVDWFSSHYNIDNYLDFSNVSIQDLSCFVETMVKNKSFAAKCLNTLPESSLKSMLQSHKVRSILTFPLFVEDAFWGFVGFNDATNNHTWTDEEFSILNSFSGTLSKSIERTLLEDRLTESLEKAKAATKAKSDFLSTMSHEIRTPLNGVIGFVDLMKKTELNSVQQQYMDSVSLSANTLLDLINDVLDYSKIEAGKLILNPESSNLIVLIEQIVDMIQFSAHKKDLEFILKTSNLCPEFVLIDAMRFRQILINLLSNAIKFTEKGEVELGMGVLSSNNDMIAIKVWVRDTGIGIDMSKVSDILESFTQADASVTRKYGGSGLGLAIVTKILQIMDSKLEIDSQPDRGSCFSFVLELPIVKSKKISTLPNKLIKNVLVIDDHHQNRLVLKEMLASFEINSDSCSSALDALSKLKSNTHFDLLIVDYHMPEMDGLTLIESIRNNFDYFGENIPIVLLHSSFDDKFIAEKAKEFRINAHYVKPLKISQLNNFIQNYQTGIMPQTIKTFEEPKPDSDFFDKSCKILIVEDNPTNMLLVKKMLTSIMPNAITIEAKDGNVAVDIVSKADIDLIFMDLHMPEMSGIEATKYIRSKLMKQELPIIALTADTSKEEKDKCFEVGMNDYLSKPVVMKDIKVIIKKHLN